MLKRRWLLAGFNVSLFAVVTACAADSGLPAGANPGSSATSGSEAAAASPATSPAALPPASPSASPSAVPRPSPAASPLPLGTRTNTSPLSSNELDQLALQFVSHLSEEMGPRASGTEQERKTAQYLEAQLEEFGYRTRLQEFTVRTLSQSASSLTLESPDILSFEVVPLGRSSTGEVNGRLVPAGLARANELPEKGLAGNIALVERGLITFREKVERLAEAGAAGAVIYNNVPGIFRGTLREAGAIPVVSISQEDGSKIQELVAEGTVKAALTVKEEIHPSQNVIAEKPGSPDGIGVVVLGAHYDSVPGTPGANDNASGTAVLLTLAEHLRDKPLPFTVRFIAFGSEELGLWGSRNYLESLSSQQQGEITAMFNFDALGSGEVIGVLGDSDLVDLVVETGGEQGIEVRARTALRAGSSDHANFLRLGIPALMFVSQDSSRIHTPSDTLEHINARLLGDAVRLALGLLESGELLTGKSP